ncbi:hypothetical protein [Cryptosporangium phraense]|uniref:Uncharacterized protein n=1 Tax=Cryptosporangium phraense TaxID=2593070 RepID=A0A545AYA6_9ACTN|nr:hypothetical protein [Cryptosporangium phraense]TQS46281.1 hypothetical protein FL583_02485 [Cryptosporangium phraense]
MSDRTGADRESAGTADEWAGPREAPSWAASEQARYAMGPPISQPSAEPWWESPTSGEPPAGPAPHPFRSRPTPAARVPAEPEAAPEQPPAPTPEPPPAANEAAPAPAPAPAPVEDAAPSAVAVAAPPKPEQKPDPVRETEHPAGPPAPEAAPLARDDDAVRGARGPEHPAPEPTGAAAPDDRDAVGGPAVAPVSSRFVDVAAVTLILTELLIRAWAAWGGYFSLDDFTFARLAAEKGLTPDLLFTPYNSHFMPGAYLLVWVETTIAPLDYRVVAGVDLALIAISFALIWLLIRRLAGPRLAALIPLAIVLFSPITLPATLWWAVSINQLAMLIAIPAALLAQLSYVRTGRKFSGALAVVVTALALPFYEKAALLVPLVFVFTVILQPHADLPDRLKSALLRHRAQWISFVLLGLVYAGIYVTRPLDKRSDSAVDLGGLLGNAATNSVPSGLLGGPWSWKAIGAVDASANPPLALRLVACAIILAVIALTVYRRPLAYQAWILLGGMLLFDVLVLAVGRLQLGSGAAMEFRYFTDLAPVAAIALTLAMFGPPEWATTWPQRAGIEWPPVLGGTRLNLANPNAVVLPLVVALFVSSLVSTVKYSNRWHENPAKGYVTNAEKSILAMGRPVDLYNGAVPEKVAWGVLNPTNFPSRLMAPLDLPINPDPDVSKDLYVLDQTGQLTHAVVTSAKAPPGNVKNCGYRISGKRVPVFLDKVLFNWWWYAELHYTAKQTTPAVFNSANTLGRQITFEQGEHVLWVKVKGPAGWITFDNVPKSAGVCLTAASVGVANPGEPVSPSGN